MAALALAQIAFREWKGTWSAYKKNSQNMVQQFKNRSNKHKYDLNSPSYSVWVQFKGLRILSAL